MPSDSRVKYHELMHILSWGITEGSRKTTGLPIAKLLDNVFSKVLDSKPRYSPMQSPNSIIKVQPSLKFKWKLEMGISSTPTLSPTVHLHSNTHYSITATICFHIHPLSRAPKDKNHVVSTLIV